MSGRVTVTVTTLPWRGGGEKKNLHRPSVNRLEKGQQVAVNLEKKRVIIHLEKGSTSVCHSPGSAKLSPAPAGEEKRVKQFAAVWRTRLAVFTTNTTDFSIGRRPENSRACLNSRSVTGNIIDRTNKRSRLSFSLLPFLEKKRNLDHLAAH